MTGLIGQLASASADGYQRPTEVAGATRSGVAVALDPNGLVYRQSPFVQNAVHVSYSGAVGIKIDGGLQPMGYDSILSNDFTQICDDGVGVWAKNGGRSEIVSVFTYYCHMGYLADSGGTIRAANCNNSYGEYGAVSSGVDDCGNCGLWDTDSATTIGECHDDCRDCDDVCDGERAQCHR